MKSEGAVLTQWNLTQLVEPKSIAVIGASTRAGAVGQAVMRNLIAAKYAGKIFPVNPKVTTLLNLPCYPSVLDIPEPVDLAVLVIPSAAIPDTIRQCSQKKVGAAIVITAGFREIGGEGKKLEADLIQAARDAHMPVLGPNCLGLINFNTNMNASFSKTIPPSGNVAFVSQSGALGTAILDYAHGQNIGLSKFVSLGNKSVLSEVDILRYLKDDPQTKVIMMYLEDIVDGKAFQKIATEITSDPVNSKPILVIKSGRTAEGAKAAQSHTGSLMGADEVYDALFEQCGVIRVNTVQEFFDYAVVFSSQPLPKGNRVAIITNAGGPGIMTTDSCVRHGLEIATLDKNTQEELKKVLPPTASVANPVDVIGDAQHDRYENALKIAHKDPNIDSLIVILTPQAMTEAKETAEAIVKMKLEFKVPVTTCFMGAQDVEAGVRILEQNHIPHYQYPENPGRALSAMVRHQKWITRTKTEVKLYEVDSTRVRGLLEHVLKQNEKMVPIHQSMEIFEAYGLPILPFRFARTRPQVVEAAAQLGFPVVLKVVSAQVVHKFDWGGVKLNLKNEQEVSDAYEAMLSGIAEKAPHAQIEGVIVQSMAEKGREVILGMNRDPLFGPVLMFGLGGVYVETFKDVTFRIAPIHGEDAKGMIEKIRAYPLLKGVRGEQPADMEKLVECLERLSQLACDHPVIQEIDINPILVYSKGKGACIVDARIILK